MRSSFQKLNLIVLIYLFFGSSLLSAEPVGVRQWLWIQAVNPWDKNGDEVLTRDEWQGQTEFDAVDFNDDGKVIRLEFVCCDPTQPCPATCTSDADCAGCPDGRTKCVNGQCMMP